MAAAQASRSVMIPGNDIAAKFGGSAFFGTMDSVDWNLIQLIYCENVLPIAKGLQSVGYSQEYLPVDGATDFDQLFLIRDSNNNNASFSPARGKNYVYSDLTGSWVSYSPFTFGAGLTIVTKGYVNGRTLIFYEKTKLVEWDPTIPNVVTRTLILPAGYTVADIRGNSAASNYHLLFSEVEIFWSTLTNVLDFSDTTQGAGRQIPIDLKGKITAVLPIAGGFMIYTTENVVAASFTNDSSRPFAYREVQNSAGVSSAEQVTGDATATGHYAYGSAGLQLLTLQRAETVQPEAADFLVSRKLEAWNPTTKQLESVVLSQNLQPKLQYLGSRYLLISYGTESITYSYALVLDTVLNRWGKLKIDHVDVGSVPLEVFGSSYRYFTLEEAYVFYDLEYDELDQNFNSVIALRQNYGFLQKNGTVMLMVTEADLVTAAAVCIFGHIQVTRTRTVTVQRAEFDGLLAGSTPTITLLGSGTGQKRDGIEEMELVDSNESYGEYHSRFTDKNIDVAVEGSFALTTLILETTINGKR